MSQVQFLPNFVAKRIGLLAAKNDRVGLTPDETHEIIDYAQTHAKMPLSVIMKRPISQVLSDLGGLMTNDQSFAYSR